MTSPLERGPKHKTARSVRFGIQGCVREGKWLETAADYDQSLGTHPLLNSPGFAVSFTLFPL